LDDPINRADVWGLSDEEEDSSPPKAETRIILAGADGLKNGKTIGELIGKKYGVKGPGGAAGMFLGNAIAMALQTAAEYPPVRTKVDQFNNFVKERLATSIEAQIPSADEEQPRQDDELYNTSPD